MILLIYLLVGLIFAIAFDMQKQPKEFGERVLNYTTMTLGWLPFLLLSIYLVAKGKLDS